MPNESQDTNTMSDDNSNTSEISTPSESVFVELMGVSPDDIPHDNHYSEHVLLANDIHQEIKENYGFDTEGVAVCVNNKYHESLNEAYHNVNSTDDAQLTLPEDTDSVALCSLDIGHHIIHPNTGECVELIDMESTGEYGSNIWVCQRVRDGQYAGTLIDKNNVEEEPRMVEYVGGADLSTTEPPKP